MEEKPVVVLMIRNVVWLSTDDTLSKQKLKNENVVDENSNAHKVIRHSEF